jgi:hypothetical protein
VHVYIEIVSRTTGILAQEALTVGLHKWGVTSSTACWRQLASCQNSPRTYM